MSKHDEEARSIALNYIGLFINNERSFALQQEISATLAARDAEIERLTEQLKKAGDGLQQLNYAYMDACAELATHRDPPAGRELGGPL